MVTEKQPPADGPSLEQYVETRLNLMAVAAEKTEAALLVRIEHLHQLNAQQEELTKRAVDKAEAAQAAHNVAANEWRGTLNDFKATLVARSEFDRLDRDFAAYKLETSTKAGQYQGEKTSAKESKETSMATLTLIVAAVSALVSIVVNKFM